MSGLNMDYWKLEFLMLLYIAYFDMYTNWQMTVVGSLINNRDKRVIYESYNDKYMWP